MSNCIYIIKNFANGKLYIGKTEREGEVEDIAKKRFQEHLQESFNEKKTAYNYCISRAIRKWGKQNFDYAILAKNVPSDDILLIEAHYIDLYNTTDPNIGYNTSSGFNDNSNIDEYRNIQPNEDYEDNSHVNISDISNEDIEQFLKEF